MSSPCFFTIRVHSHYVHWHFSTLDKHKSLQGHIENHALHYPLTTAHCKAKLPAVCMLKQSFLQAVWMSPKSLPTINKCSFVLYNKDAIFIQSTVYGSYIKDTGFNKKNIYCEFMKAYALIKPLPRSKQHSVKQMNIIFFIFASFLLYGVSVRFPYTCCVFIIFRFPVTFLNKIMFCFFCLFFNSEFSHCI